MEKTPLVDNFDSVIEKDLVKQIKGQALDSLVTLGRHRVIGLIDRRRVHLFLEQKDLTIPLKLETFVIS